MGYENVRGLWTQGRVDKDVKVIYVDKVLNHYLSIIRKHFSSCAVGRLAFFKLLIVILVGSLSVSSMPLSLEGHEDVAVDDDGVVHVTIIVEIQVVFEDFIKLKGQ